ncbi:zinc-ribbon and DUF3426 domain-containing protein [Agrilutibacter solisilvae]|uniref:Zinc-ribbon and DUF3426 domain-containing protein n=1 Tax=Agrilutibacter solisilvae TaxID=2763317 RepID=A0A975ATM5_9GAMM|nr:zinc-ribbon and DUF3426 domain-containing protein [Lysobacter solisilvae]QSX79463.1 zinc-ribbon and DUF3426 domain-containing protein [Lysobacter solisilvae]
MFVTCPHCGFLVASQNGGSLRCPRCGALIDPRTAKPFEAPADAVAPVPVRADAPDAGETTPAPTAPPAPAALHSARARRAPSFVPRRAPSPLQLRDWRMWAAIAALLLLLLLQSVLSQRDQLAADARWRPLVSGLCGVLQCEVPAWREPAAFTMLQRSVQPRRDARGVLSVSASFRNDARWPQPWPTLLLTLSDMEGRQVGLRAFEPADYRRGATDSPIAPGQSATIQLEVVEPARPVVAFTFDFR